MDEITFLIVDDDELDRLVILRETLKYPFLKAQAVCCTAGEALAAAGQCLPDVIFSDIEMPDINGKALIRQLSGKIPVPVFITSHPEFALESYNLEIFDYLLKPVSSERFEKCVLRIQDFFALRKKIADLEKRQDTDYIHIKQGHEKHKLQINDIIYLEAMKDYTKIKTTAERSLLVLETLSGLLRQLPQEKFIRIHRSYAVNKSRITTIGPHKITISGAEFPIGKSFKNALQALPL